MHNGRRRQSIVSLWYTAGVNLPLDLFAGVVPFVATAEAGSVRGGARLLGVTPSAVSKAIARLEGELGLRLLDRTARRVRLTDEGQDIARLYREATARALAARDLAIEAHRRPQGTLRVSAPVALGQLVLVPALPRLTGRYPDLKIELNLTDRRVSFAEDRVEVALRIGDRGPPGAARARRVATTRWITAASPAYLARRGTPHTPRELAGHDCLRFVSPSGRPFEWTFLDPRSGRARTARVDGRLSADDGNALVAAAVAGLGVIQAIDFMVESELAGGALLEVLADHAAPGPPVYLLTAPGHGRSPRVRAFADLAAELFSRPGAGS